MPGGVHNAEENMEKSIEQIFSELDQILEKLEAADTSLEDSFACYEAGMKLVRSCGEKIDKVEKQIIVLQGGEDADGEG